MCAKHALQSFANLLKGSHVKWYTDNKGVASIVKSGSSKVRLHKLAMEIFSLSKEHNVSLILNGFRVQRMKLLTI